VILLEARNRVSGRSLTGRLEGGGWIDYGGQWVGPTQDRFYELIKEMGGQTYPTHDHGAGLERSILDPAVPNENARALVGGVVSSVACASTSEISILEMAYLVRAL
jgi:monoamine oxidase